MHNSSATAAFLILAAGGSVPPLLLAQILLAQSPNEVVAYPGNDVVTGTLVPPSRRRFTILSTTGCELDSEGPQSEQGYLVEEVRVMADTALLFVREWHRADSPVVDTTVLDRRTLAPLWSHAHFQHNASASWEFRDRRVLWSGLQPSGETESLDSTVEARPFLAGTTSLLLSATPRLYLANVRIAFSLIDLLAGPSEPSSFWLHTAAARVTGSEVLKLPSGKRVDTWVVTSDGPETYWVDKRSHEVLGWHFPPYESICPTTYIRSSP